MRHSEGQAYQAGRRIQAFLDANDALVGNINRSATRAELDSVVDTLGVDAGVQATGRATARGESAKQGSLRLALELNHMRPIAAVARLKLRSVPNFAALTMPRSRLTGKSLVAYATGMGGAAQPYEQVFIDAGLPPDFLARLSAATAAVEASIFVRSTARGSQSKATGSLKQHELRARRLFRALNDLVTPVLAVGDGNSGLLAEWNSARRIALKPGRVVGSEASTKLSSTGSGGTPVAPAPASPPTVASPELKSA
jgi:hypothetical protein